MTRGSGAGLPPASTSGEARSKRQVLSQTVSRGWKCGVLARLLPPARAPQPAERGETLLVGEKHVSSCGAARLTISASTQHGSSARQMGCSTARAAASSSPGAIKIPQLLLFAAAAAASVTPTNGTDRPAAVPVHMDRPQQQQTEQMERLRVLLPQPEQLPEQAGQQEQQQQQGRHVQGERKPQRLGENASTTRRHEQGRQPPGRQLQSACEPGTTQAYNDEALGFRFQSEGIGRDGNGSVVWNATAPADLAFTMAPPSEFQYVGTGDWIGGDIPRVEPSLEVDPEGVPVGISFRSIYETARVLVSTRKVAIGAGFTFFAVVTPTAEPVVHGSILAFRPGGVPGSFGWMLADPQYCVAELSRCMRSDTWGYSGFAGPSYFLNRTQIFVYRSHLGLNGEGAEVSISEMVALVKHPDALDLMWASRQYGVGHEPMYNAAEFSSGDEDFGTLDFRTPDEVDAKVLVGGGHMFLGGWIDNYPAV